MGGRLRDIENLVFSGGGVNGGISCGALMFLERLFLENGLTLSERIIGFAGCSVGAMIALLLAIGVSASEAIDAFQPVVQSIKEQRASLPGTIIRGGLGDLNELRSKIASIMEERLGPGGSCFTFGHIFWNLGRQLVVAVNEVRGSCLALLNSQDYPGVVALDAVIASMSIPLIFPPVRIRGMNSSLWFSDGGVMLNFPWKCFPPMKTLGFWLLDPPISSSYLQKVQNPATENDAVPLGPPPFHTIVLSLQRSLLKSLGSAEKQQFLTANTSESRNVIPLYNSAAGYNFGLLTSEFMQRLVKKGAFLAWMHFMGISPSDSLEGADWRTSTRAFLSVDVGPSLKFKPLLDYFISLVLVEYQTRGRGVQREQG